MLAPEKHHAWVEQTSDLISTHHASCQAPCTQVHVSPMRHRQIPSVSSAYRLPVEVHVDVLDVPKVSKRLVDVLLLRLVVDARHEDHLALDRSRRTWPCAPFHPR